MDLRPLSEVDLREAIGPINRAVTGHYLPSVRTVSQLRERAQLGILDLKLSRCAYIGGKLVGTCLVERVDERAHLDAIGVDPLAQQRGVGHALLEAACVAAEALGVRTFTAEVSDSDAPSLATLQSAGFTRHRGVTRYELRGQPVVPEGGLPEEVPEGPHGPTLGQTFIRKVPLSEAMEYILQERLGRDFPDDRARPEAPDPPFCQQAAVLGRLAPRLCSFLMLQLESQHPQDPQDPVIGAAVIEKDRHQLLALAGQPDRLPALVSLLLCRYGVTLFDSVPEQPGQPGELGAVLARTGLSPVVVRVELVRSF